MESAAISGYNACILAYGQSGSGKTFTVLGDKEAPGLAPRICEGLLTRLQQRYDPEDLCAQDFTLSLSLIEIYKERVRDLLTSSDASRPLKVREHPHTGPYVDGVTRHIITDTATACSLLEKGRSSRSVASTASHAHSSRSHALLTLDITQPAAHTRSTLTLVDLAGSERASEELDRMRLTEGASINRSLVTLGNVISALAERGGSIGSTRASPTGSNISLNSTSASYANPTGCHQFGDMINSSPKRIKSLPFIPYRDSVLTWLLKDSLGGNAKTLMIATISPSSTNYNESVATLRYATRARCIINVPVVNLDSSVDAIRNLKKEVAALKRFLCKASPTVMHSLGLSSNALLNFISRASATDLTQDWIERFHKDKEDRYEGRHSYKSSEDSDGSSRRRRLRMRSAPSGCCGNSIHTGSTYSCSENDTCLQCGHDCIHKKKPCIHSEESRSITKQNCFHSGCCIHNSNCFHCQQSCIFSKNNKSSEVNRSCINATTQTHLSCSTTSLLANEAAQSLEMSREVIVDTELPYMINTLGDAHASSIILYHIKNGASVIGSGEMADFHLSGPGVAPSHCTLTHARGAVSLRCLPSCEVIINDNTVREGTAKRLWDGDLLVIGPRKFTFHAPTRKRPRSRSCPRQQVVVESEDEVEFSSKRKSKSTSHRDQRDTQSNACRYQIQQGQLREKIASKAA
ncbi:stAR-related lipid transfer [Halocaridina rubra]|uniref:Kinesin-like protein n=1 Tax=Halocaridina rubra TaxID=373956 RepID=A0AAN8ZTA5_HALRR